MEAMRILQAEDDLKNIVKLVGPEALPDKQRLILETAQNNPYWSSAAERFGSRGHVLFSAEAVQDAEDNRGLPPSSPTKS